MTEKRWRFIRDLDSLAPLSDHTDTIAVNQEGHVEVVRKLPPPNDEFGIPRPELMVEKLLGAMDTENYVWTGRFDEHHLATPKADFTIVRTKNEGDVGSAFRGLSCLKIDLTRQMHNFAHAIFELPGRPSIDVMRQALVEVGQAKRLQTICNEYLPTYPERTTEQDQRLCVGALQRAIEQMKEPEVGMLPRLEALATMELSDLQVTVNALLRVRQFSDKQLVHPAVRRHSGYRHRLTRPIKTAA